MTKMLMGKKIFKIKCLTNLHVGAGDVEVSIIDNQVQKDSITKYPTINGSSLKGALRSHFSKKNENSNNVNLWFGKEGSDSEVSEAGKLKILTANLLAFPIVSDKITDKNSKPYVLYTNEYIAKEYEELTGNKLKIESYKENDCCSAFFDQVTSLPVIARNCLENGISKNLWYEEIVPRQTEFYFMVLSEDKKLLLTFSEEIKESEYIQIGANASIGCGYCKITEM